MTPSGIALVSRITKTIHHQHLIRPGDTLIVGLSGGADSVALLDLLSRIPGYHLNLVAAHLNHCLRGVESDADEEFCCGVATRYGIAIELRRIDVKKQAEDRHQNLEDAGRIARIDFFDEIRNKYSAVSVALAHHADDQAETVLMRLLRGSGMTGLSGMSYRNSRGYIRPMLDISRSDIEHYLHECGLNWREDASNSDTIYLRNRIRHQLLPLLEGYNPAIRSSLTATATLLRGDEALLSSLTEQAFAASCRVGDRSVVCSLVHLRGYEVALQRRVIRHCFKQLTTTLERISQRHIDAVRDLIDSDRPNSRVSLPHGVEAVREYDQLKLLYRATTLTESNVELLITAAGCYQMPDGGSLLVEIVPAEGFSTTFNSACFDCASTPFPWLVRSYSPGDRMTPFGMQGRKKVKDIFIDKKIPLSQRSRIPLLWCGTDLIWIAGVCISELCRRDLSSCSHFRVTWHQ